MHQLLIEKVLVKLLSVDLVNPGCVGDRSGVLYLLKYLLSTLLSKRHEPLQNRGGEGPGAVTSLIQKADWGLGFTAPQRRPASLTPHK